MPEALIAGGGLAGMAAATRLLEQGFDVTLFEQDDFLGGKLGAHIDAETGDAHEHSYHMYLNWYHNFWRLMEEIGARKKFRAAPDIDYLRPGVPGLAATMTNVGSPWTLLHNLYYGVAPPADMAIYGVSLLDLLATPPGRDDQLGHTSVYDFMRSLPYNTQAAMGNAFRTLAEAFASPSYLSSARSYRSLIRYGFRLPEPSMWLLRGDTKTTIFDPWRQYLEARAAQYRRRLRIEMLTRVQEVHLANGRVRGLALGRLPHSPTIHSGEPVIPTDTRIIEVHDDLILAVPPGALGRLVNPTMHALAPRLADVRRLRCEPMVSLDVCFKRRLDWVPEDITILLESRFNLSLLDISTLWGHRDGPTILNVVASDCDTIATYPDDVVQDLMLRELTRFLKFRYDPVSRNDDIDYRRTHIQTNVGEELFVNQVGSWEYRPRTTCEIPNLFLAGDFCQTPVDVVTIEGAVVSGLMAAEALRRRHAIGTPIEIVEPEAYPRLAMALAAAAARPFGYLAKGVSVAETAVSSGFRQWFPNG